MKGGTFDFDSMIGPCAAIATRLAIVAFVSVVERHMLAVIFSVGMLHIDLWSSVTTAVMDAEKKTVPDLGVNWQFVMGIGCRLLGLVLMKLSHYHHFCPFESSKPDVGPESSF